MIVLQASCSTSSKAHNPTRTGLSYSCYGDGAVAFNTVSCCYHRGLCSLCEFCVRMVSSWYKRTAPRLLGASSIEIPILVGMEGSALILAAEKRWYNAAITDATMIAATTGASGKESPVALGTPVWAGVVYVGSSPVASSSIPIPPTLSGQPRKQKDQVRVFMNGMRTNCCLRKRSGTRTCGGGLF
jgi:hypothetical protein